MKGIKIKIKLKKKQNVCPFFKEKDIFFINLDYLKYSKKNKKILKTFLYSLIDKNKDVILIGNLSIKNFILILELFPSIEIEM